MYTFKFWFEHGGGCLWSADDNTRTQYGYKVAYTSLPISDHLKHTLMDLEAEYRTILNWDDPAAGSQWSEEQKATFLHRAQMVYDKLCHELGDDYRLIDELVSSV